MKDTILAGVLHGNRDLRVSKNSPSPHGRRALCCCGFAAGPLRD